MRIAVVDPNYSDAWIEAHKEGCQHLGRRKPVHYVLEADSREAFASQAASDFIDEGSMTLEEVVGNTKFAPCLRFLPERSI